MLFKLARGLETKVPPSGSHGPGSLGSHRGAMMRDAETYLRYATECERIARTMTEEHRKSLLAIAEAWRELAREAERRSESRD
jgi:hypothetical protein